MQAWNDCVGLGRFTNNNIIMMEDGTGAGAGGGTDNC